MFNCFSKKKKSLFINIINNYFDIIIYLAQKTKIYKCLLIINKIHKINNNNTFDSIIIDDIIIYVKKKIGRLKILMLCHIPRYIF